MDPTCLSSATILRCLSLTRGQNIAFIVPVAMEFVGSCLLIFFKWGSGKQHLLLVAEGWIYFILALVELCSVIPSLSKDNANLFRSFDIGIGILSFLPLGLYTLYLFLFTRRKLLVNLPKYVIKVAKVSMFLALPLIIATNEVASVSRITISFDSTGIIPSFAFSDKHVEWLCLFFTALTLAVLAAYQATIFSLTFFRLIWILVQRRRGQHDMRIGGLGWVSAGVITGALEAIIGFAGGRFEVSMIRRLMRFVGRACLCIGAVVGVDPITDSYDNLERPKKKGARRRQTHRSLRMMISDPRFSTFQELSPMATGFHAAHREPSAPRTLQTSATTPKTPHYLPYSQRHRHEAFNLHRFPIIKESPNQRVTVLYDVEGGPPLLQMRFSVLGVPLTVSTPTSEHEKEWDKLRFTELTQPALPVQAPFKTPPPLDNADGALPSPNPPFAQEGKNRSNRGSASSIASSIVEIIDVPRRTFSQRLAEARLYRARTREVGDQESKGTGSPSLGGDSDSPLSRTPTPGQLFSLSRLSHNSSSNLVYHMRGADNQSISVKSISDSIQAVQELASQFPTLPSTPSLDFCLEYATPACGEMTCTSGQFVFAIGSPSDLEVSRASDMHPSSATEDDTGSCRNLLPQGNGHQRQPSEEDIVRTPRQQEHIMSSGPRTPSSNHTSATITGRPTVSPNPVGPIEALGTTTTTTSSIPITTRPVLLQPPSLVGFGTNPFVPKPFGDPTRVPDGGDTAGFPSKKPLAVIHERSPPPPTLPPSPPHTLDNNTNNNNRGGFSVHSRVAGPRTMGRVPTAVSSNNTTTTTNRSSVRGHVGPHMKPIVVPRRRSNLPKAIQWSEDGIPIV